MSDSVASVSYMSVTTTGAGFLGLNMLQLPKEHMGPTEALSIYNSYLEMLIHRWLP